MRHFKRPLSASTILDGYCTHYNFLKEHSGIGGNTPAREAGIGFEIQNWGDIIQCGLDMVLTGNERTNIAENPGHVPALKITRTKTNKIENLDLAEWNSRAKDSIEEGGDE